jgi:hypothetical protein
MVENRTIDLFWPQGAIGFPLEKAEKNIGIEFAYCGLEEIDDEKNTDHFNHAIAGIPWNDVL